MSTIDTAVQGGRTIEVRIKRQYDAGSAPYWEEYSLPYKPNMNVISCLMEIQRNPVTRAGQKVTPPHWEASCLEEVCGSCSMNVNGRARQACTALVDKLDSPIVLEPFTKFPVVRDLVTDRSRMFESLKRVRAWVPIQGTYDLGPGPRESPDQQAWRYVLETCMTCGCCLEACPQVNDHSPFVGPQTIAQVDYFNTHPTGALNKAERLHAIRDEGGVQDCGKAQNCVQVCPKQIPLTDAISRVFRDTWVQGLKDWIGG